MGNYFSSSAIPNQENNTANNNNNCSKTLPNELDELEQILKVIPMEGPMAAAHVAAHIEKHSFAAIRLPASNRSTLANLVSETDHFFKQPAQSKNAFASTDKKNMGYLDIRTTREYLKLRRQNKNENQNHKNINQNTNTVQDDENQKENKKLLNSFEDGFTVFEMVAFEIFKSMVALNNKTNRRPMKPEECESILQACKERASISSIHYYRQLPSQHESLHDVCSSHTDTGILTFVCVNQIPGLEFKYKDKWIPVEDMLKKQMTSDSDGPILMIMPGEKSRLFFSIDPTTHRVVIPADIDRFSLLYFMDCVDM